MLIRSRFEAVDVALIRPFIKQFRQLDITNDGRLGIEDLALKETLSKEELLQRQKQNSSSRHNSGVSLVGLSAKGSGAELPVPAKPSPSA